MTRQGFNQSAYLCSAASAVMVAASPAVAHAQDDATAGAEADKPESVIVVTANRRSQDVTGIPFNISVVGGEQLAASGCQRRYKKGPATGLKVGQSIQTKSLSLRLGLIGVGEAAVA